MSQESSKNGQAGVEVSPEMIEAGAHTLIMLTISDLATGDITAQEASVCVYEAMERVRLRMPE